MQRPGVFSLVHLEGLGQSGAPAFSMAGAAGAFRAPQDFNLDTLRATDRFYFLLTNGGDVSITGVSIASSNPAFVVSPGSITELPPDTALSIGPIIRVTAVHGFAATGIGFADLMPAGTNATTMHLAGSTVDTTGNTIAVTLDTELRLHALVMDARLVDDDGEMDLSTGGGTAIGLPQAGGAGVRTFSPFGSLTVENTGNVPIALTVWEGNGTELGTAAAAPGETVDLTSLLPPNQVAFVWFDGGGVVSDGTRLAALPNGRVILGFSVIPP